MSQPEPTNQTRSTPSTYPTRLSSQNPSTVPSASPPAEYPTRRAVDVDLADRSGLERGRTGVSRLPKSFEPEDAQPLEPGTTNLFQPPTSVPPLLPQIHDLRNIMDQHRIHMSIAAALERQYSSLLDSIIDTMSSAELPSSQMYARSINPDLAACSNPIEEVCRQPDVTTFRSEHHTHFSPIVPLDARATANWDVSTLLTMNGDVAQSPILDTGARHVMLGASYAKELGLTGDKLLLGTH